MRNGFLEYAAGQWVFGAFSRDIVGLCSRGMDCWIMQERK
jgi:hypothetical protein